LLHAELSLGLYDAFDRRPVDPGSDSVLHPISPQDGRTWQFRINIKL
jgi:outer membrane receptor protein involved in Fe transport